MRWHQHLWLQGRHHLFKGSAFVVTSCLFVLVFIFQPKWINQGLDVNLGLVRGAAHAIDVRFPWWGDAFEAFSRFFNYERLLLFGEAVAVVKLVMLAVGAMFRKCIQAFN